MDELVYCEPKEVKTTKLSDITDKQVVICKCTGQEKVTFVDEDKVPSYSGVLKSPLSIIWVYPREDVKFITSPSDIRKWVKDACEYHKIPHVLLALILQNENYPEASLDTQILQFGERSLQTSFKIIDSWTNFTNYLEPFSDNELVKGTIKFVRGSSGIANVSDNALNDGVKHCIEKYARPPIPSSVARTIFGINTDSRISGIDWRNDLYYAAAYLKFLIDKNFGDCFSSELSYNMLYTILRAYNGPGDSSKTYADDAMQILNLAISQKGVLYFYEK